MLLSRPLILLHPKMQVDASVPLRSPAVVLRDDYMQPHGINTQRLARHTGIYERQLRRILRGEPLRAEDALRLAIEFQTTALYWRVLQARYDLERLRIGTAPEGSGAY